MKKHLVLFTAGYPSKSRPNLGIFTHRSARMLSEKFQVTAIHFRAFNFKRKWIIQEQMDGIPLYRLAVPQVPHYNIPILMKVNIFLYRFFGWFLLKKIIHSADVLHSTGLIPTGLIVEKWAQKSNKIHVSQAIGSDVNVYLPNFTSPFWKQQFNRFSLLQFNSFALQNHFLSLIPIDIKKFVAYRGVDTVYFKPKAAQTNPIVRFLFLGGLQTTSKEHAEKFNVKGGHILLDAWKLIEQEQNNVFLHFGGPGIDRTYLENWKTSLLHSEKFEIGGRISPKEVATKLANYDVVVIPSLNEGLPNLANEAQSSGVPVLGTDAGGIKESVIHGETGLIVAKNNVKTLKDGLDWFIKNPEKIRTLGENGRKRMLEHFTWERYVSKMETEINNLQN